MGFNSATLTVLNTNVLNEVTTSVDIKANTSFVWCIISVSGDHDNHKVVMQVSLDNSVWSDSNSKLEGSEVMSIEHDLPFGYIRFKVLIAEGATSTVDVGINAK